MAKRTLHVVPDGGNWAVKENGRTVYTSGTQSSAELWAKNQGDVEVVVHRPSGQIRDSDSMGRAHDPVPPRDRKH